jgi:hypothetical protein
MAKRKETPDVLSEILGGEPAAPPPAPKAAREAKPKVPAKRRAPAKRASRPSRPKRQTWEYREVIFRDYDGLRPMRVNGEDLDAWKDGPIIHEYLNQLGAEGWELAGVGSKHNREMPVYLKRVKA